MVDRRCSGGVIREPKRILHRARKPAEAEEHIQVRAFCAGIGQLHAGVGWKLTLDRKIPDLCVPDTIVRIHRHGI